MLSHKKPDSHINVKVEFGEGEGKVPLKARFLPCLEMQDKGKEKQMTNSIIMLCGRIGSGKTTYAKMLQREKR